MNPISYIQDKLRLLDIEANQSQLEQLFRFYELLIEKNKVMNLTGITDFEEVVEKHFVDSLIIHKFRDLNQQEKIIEILRMLSGLISQKNQSHHWRRTTLLYGTISYDNGINLKLFNT